ncbi:zinc finger and SCAN domain-containing protein 31 isoform X2 [Drosophila santomea]|uniref:zinc finger and SCAN domain-containing protein 31 isoform X2 n=1 Tax=Drosophila santomea TaxID=129105 RepID=UPI001953B2D4|nr:zinc finger and SCAN domain-containing protein 31 isoform X2 [Drosophila santomea]
MTTLCRTCGQKAEHAKALFDKEGSDVLNNILKLTGLWLRHQSGVPTRICLSCLLDLNDAIAFRELCIKTNSSWFENQSKQEVSGSEQKTTREDRNNRAKSGVDVVPVNIVPINIVPLAQPQNILVQGRIPPQRSKIVDEIPLRTLETPIYPLIVPEIPPADLVDPLRCEDPILVKSELLLSDVKPEESINQKEAESEILQVMKEDPRIPQVTEEVRKKRRKTRRKDYLEECAGNEMVEMENTNSITPATADEVSPTRRNKSKEDKYATRNKWGAAKRAYALEHRLYFCDQCGKTFSEKGNFNVHLRRHKGTKEFQCKECDRKEFTQHLLNLHVRIKHRGELPYVCKYCGKRFDNCLKRLNHERNHKESPVHRPHVCSTCQKAFKTSTALKDHSVVHTGEQPFHCELCQTSFNRRNALATHYKSKHHRMKVEEQSKNPGGDITVQPKG